ARTRRSSPWPWTDHARPRPDMPSRRTRLVVPVLHGLGIGLPEVVDLRRVAAAQPARDRPHLDRLVAAVAVRARRLGRDPHRGAGRHLDDLVAEAHRQRAARDEVQLLDLLVDVAGALL